ncbi:hypothetical protein D3C73_1013810 [compost metagenome]
MPNQAFLPGGAFSVASSTAPPHSPPRPSPWPKRHRASSKGAITPTECQVGKRPMATVDRPMVIRAATRVALRPTRSPKWPKTKAPIGRAKKAMEKVAKEASMAVIRSPPGKKRSGKTSTAAVA